MSDTLPMRPEKVYRCALCGEPKTMKPGGKRWRCNRHLGPGGRIRPGPQHPNPIDRMIADLDLEVS